MDLTEGSETSANIKQTLGKHPKVNAVNTEHSESLKSRSLIFKKKAWYKTRRTILLGQNIQSSNKVRYGGLRVKLKKWVSKICGRQETERAQHIICRCEAMARRRYYVFGDSVVEPKDISTASARDLCLFIRGTRLLNLC
jgi:hypothetical protein